MPTQLQLRRGTTVQHNTFTGAVGEVTVNTTKKTAVVHDGSTAGGLELLRADMSNVFAAATPSITSLTTSGNVDVGGNLTVTGTTTFNGGTITMGDADTDNVVFGADVNSNILPNTDNTYSLGNSSKKWSDVRTVLLTTTGAASLGSTLDVTGNVAVNTNKFTVNATTGDTVVAGDLSIGGGDIIVPAGNLRITTPAIGTQLILNSNGSGVDIGNAFGSGIIVVRDFTTFFKSIEIVGQSLSTNQTTFNLLNTNATTLNVGGAATTLNLGAASGTTTVGNNLTVTGNLTVNGATTTVNSTTLTVDDKNIELASTASPSDVLADGAGITIKGTTDKTFNWVDATDAFTSSENLETAAGKTVALSGSTSGKTTLNVLATASGTLTLPSATDTLVGKATTDTLTNKSISLTTNTISGTLAEFNTALSDDNFVSLTGAETLTNKTLTSPIISSISNTGTLTLPTSTDTLVGRDTTDTLTNKTLTEPKFVNGGFIADDTGNEQIKFTKTASAVNELTVSNAATTNRPSIEATGDDTNIGISITPKGTGTIVVGNSIIPSANATMDLGSASNKFRDLYLHNSSFFMGTTKVTMHADGYLVFNNNSGGGYPAGSNVSVATATNGVAPTTSTTAALAIALGG